MSLLKIAIFCYLCIFPVKEKELGIKLPKDFKGKVIAIKDGDTIEVLYESNTITIRFAHIDCPEIKKHQPFGQAAKKFTSDMCYGRMVTVQNEGKFDRNNRLIGVIINDKGDHVNKSLLKAGFAWHFKKYSTDKSYNDLELIARKNRTGLWADENPIPPWKWRKG